MFSAVRKTHLNFKKSFTVLPALGDLKGCVDGRKAQNKQADESGKKNLNKFTLFGGESLTALVPDKKEFGLRTVKKEKKKSNKQCVLSLFIIQ